MSQVDHAGQHFLHAFRILGGVEHLGRNLDAVQGQVVKESQGGGTAAEVVQDDAVA